MIFDMLSYAYSRMLHLYEAANIVWWWRKPKSRTRCKRFTLTIYYHNKYNFSRDVSGILSGERYWWDYKYIKAIQLGQVLKFVFYFLFIYAEFLLYKKGNAGNVIILVQFLRTWRACPWAYCFLWWHYKCRIKAI